MISYTISVYNEIQELQRLVYILNNIKNLSDEIVVLQTYRQISEQSQQSYLDIQNFCKKYIDIYDTFHFCNNFANMKNYLNNLATKEYIINFDADEFATEETIKLWKKIISENNNDLYHVPRINTVNNYTIEDVKNYQWQINGNGWINWPDYQPRIFKNNKLIKWIGDVHEHLEGFNNQSALPQAPQLAIIHHKTIEKQRSQNMLYNNINNDK